MPATALWIGLPDLKSLARRQVGSLIHVPRMDARSVHLPNGGCWQYMDTPRLRRGAFAGAVVRLGAVRMAATRRRSRYLGKPGIDWTLGDECCDGSFALSSAPACAWSGLRKPARLGRIIQGGGGLRRFPSPAGGPVLDGESYTASPRGADAVYSDRPRVYPIRRPARLAGSSSADASAAAEEARSIGGSAKRFRRLSGGERRRGSKGLLASRWLRRTGTRQEQERVPRQQPDCRKQSG